MRFNRHLLAPFVIGTVLSAQGAFPSTVPVQGRLTLPNGTAANGTYKVTFRIYSTATAGSALWSEVQNRVSVVKGVWKAELGSVVGFPATLFTGKPRWLGIQVASDSEMVPRIAVSAQAFAKLAENAFDVKGRDIHPKTVTIGARQVIDGSGKWVGDPSGLKGPKGDTGATGVRGATGGVGAAGVRGPKGDTGLAGPRGQKGNPGAKGAQGATGPMGSPGSANITGTLGRLVRFTNSSSGGDSRLLDDAVTTGVNQLSAGTLFNVHVNRSATSPPTGLTVLNRYAGTSSKTGLYVSASLEGTGSKTGAYVEARQGSSARFPATGLRAAVFNAAAQRSLGLDVRVDHTGSAGSPIGATVSVVNSNTQGAIGVDTLVRGGATKGRDVIGFRANVRSSGQGDPIAYWGWCDKRFNRTAWGVYIGSADANYLNGRLAVGIRKDPAYTLHVRNAQPWLAEFDQLDSSKAGMIRFARNGSYKGGITMWRGTVTYGAFTGAHYADLDGACESGMIVTLTGRNRRFSESTAEPVYGCILASAANQANVLGTYGNHMPSQDGDEAYDIIHAVGNTDVWVVDNGVDIQAGDPLITSRVAGHAMRDNGEFEIANVFARAAVAVDWSQVTETIDGVKRKKITVLLDSFVVNHGAQKLTRAVAALMEANRVLRLELADERERNANSERRLARVERILSALEARK